MAVTLGAAVLERYRRFSLYNSPFHAHDDGRAIDLYPEGEVVPSPVAGEVRDVRRVRAPPKPYAADHDSLLLVDTGDHVARLLHVNPRVEAGETVAVGDPLGPSIRAGFFAPWVPDHLHLEFRAPGADPYRAAGSERIGVDVPVEPLSWDGTGRVVEAGETWARLDSPAHPAPGERFVGLGATVDGTGPVVLDGGLPHYAGGGVVGGPAGPTEGVHGPVGLAGATVGDAAGRDVTWRDVTVRANGDPVTGLALFAARDAVGVKLVGEEVSLSVGEAVRVTVD